MLTMILSVVYYGHSLNHKQWMGVGLVFGGIGFEAYLKRKAESKKAAERAAKAKEEKAQ